MSVVVCTRNPRRDYLRRVVAALRGQTLDPGRWDLLVVDNDSDEPVVVDGLAEWHPRARVVREPNHGLIHARLRGIGETTGDLLLFVDDDNVLCPNYMEEAVRIADSFPMIGAFGAGVIEGEFENAPPRLPRFVREHLTLRAHRRPVRSRGISPRICPSGAGMVVRRRVADLYLRKVRDGRLTLATLMDKVGIPLSSRGANDFDLGYQAGCLEMEMGVFPSLRLTHLLEARRTGDAYLMKLVRNNARAMALLAFVYNDRRMPRRRIPRYAPLLWVTGQRGVLLRREWWKGEVEAYRLLHENWKAVEELE